MWRVRLKWVHVSSALGRCHSRRGARSTTSTSTAFSAEAECGAPKGASSSCSCFSCHCPCPSSFSLLLSPLEWGVLGDVLLLVLRVIVFVLVHHLLLLSSLGSSAEAPWLKIPSSYWVLAYNEFSNRAVDKLHHFL